MSIKLHVALISSLITQIEGAYQLLLSPNDDSYIRKTLLTQWVRSWTIDIFIIELLPTNEKERSNFHDRK